ncbi:hypothetical protein WUBG_09760 [Wuchereria bancrofti]|uniref:RRM domain-containing protein n=1 Tax=Wuchereria bancrofti TaxID=6293 RepID=J9EQJ2_WUCBA|nr:hypothetical protein WUBG_09760 [Wuchereria bancrofti]
MNPDTNYIRLRGLPFAAKEQDVRDFLQVFFFGLNAKSITFTLTSNGRASGECYVELDDQEAVKEAQKLDRNEINGRYIEVFSVSDAELLMMIRHGVIKGSGGDADSRYASNFVVRLRGLPYSATIDDIKEFFSGLEVADAVIDKEPGGRPSGEAFVRLATKEYAELALERSKNYMGSRKESEVFLLYGIRAASIRQLVDEACERRDTRVRNARLYHDLAELRRTKWVLHNHFELLL